MGDVHNEQAGQTDHYWARKWAEVVNELHIINSTYALRFPWFSDAHKTIQAPVNSGRSYSASHYDSLTTNKLGDNGNLVGACLSGIRETDLSEMDGQSRIQYAGQPF